MQDECGRCQDSQGAVAAGLPRTGSAAHKLTLVERACGARVAAANLLPAGVGAA